MATRVGANLLLMKIFIIAYFVSLSDPGTPPHSMEGGQVARTGFMGTHRPRFGCQRIAATVEIEGHAGAQVSPGG